MDGHARLLLKYPSEVKWRSVHSACNVVKRDAFAHPRGEVGLGGLSKIGVVRARGLSFRLSCDATLHECGLEHVGDEL